MAVKKKQETIIKQEKAKIRYQNLFEEQKELKRPVGAGIKDQ